MEFCQLAGYHHVRGLSPHRLHVGQCLQNAMRSLIDDQGEASHASGQRFQLRPPRAWLGRQKSCIEEAIRIQAGGDQRSKRGIGSGDRNDRDACRHRRAHQVQSRIREGRRTRIADHCDPASLLQEGYQLQRSRLLVVLVVADGRGGDGKVIQQLLRLAGVLAGNAVDFLQHPERTKSDVFKIADRRGDQI